MTDDRILALEKRVSRLEKIMSSARSFTGRSCKKCGLPDPEFISSRKDPHFGIFGATIDTYRCQSCGLEAEVHSKNEKS